MTLVLFISNPTRKQVGDWYVRGPQSVQLLCHNCAYHLVYDNNIRCKISATKKPLYCSRCRERL